MTREQLKQQWLERITPALRGRTIAAVRYTSEPERRQLMWERSAVVLILDDGTQLFPACDDEGNDAGALFTTIPGLGTIPVI
jgi:hypothetical protein